MPEGGTLVAKYKQRYMPFKAVNEDLVNPTDVKGKILNSRGDSGTVITRFEQLSFWHG